MFIYIFIFVFLLLSSYLGDYRHIRLRYNTTYILAMIILILFAGLRNRVGCDSIGYENDFNELQITLKNSDGIKGIFTINQLFWTLTMYLVKITTGSFVIFQLLHAIVLNILLFRFVKRITTYCFTAITLIFVLCWWNLSFEVLRESICVALFVNATLDLNEKNYAKYIIYAVIAAYYHWFAFVPFIIQPLVILINKRLVYTSFIGLFIFVLFFVDTQLINSALILLSGEMNSEASKRMISYTMDYSHYGFVNINPIGLTKLLLLDVLLPIMVVRNCRNSKYSKLLGTMCFLYAFFSIMATKIVISGRFCNYYIVPLCVASAIALYNNKNYWTNKFIGGLLFLNILFSVRNFYLPDPENPNKSIGYDCRYLPYTTIFQDPDPIREKYYGK